MTLLLLAALIALALSALFGGFAPRLWLGAVLQGAALTAVGAVSVLADGTVWDWRSGLALGGEPLHFRLDGISALFLILLGVVGAAGAVYGHEYWDATAHPRSARSGRVWWSALVLCLGLVALGERPAFSHRVGAVHAQRLFSDHPGPAAARSARGGLALSRGVARGRALPLRLLPPARGAHGKLGTRTHARARWNWRRCSGWRCSGSA